MTTEAEQTTHECPGLFCRVRVPAHMMACPPHWYTIPKSLRDAVWQTWEGGAGAGSDAHARAVTAAVMALNGRLIRQPGASDRARMEARSTYVSAAVDAITRLIPGDGDEPGDGDIRTLAEILTVVWDAGHAYTTIRSQAGDAGVESAVRRIEDILQASVGPDRDRIAGVISAVWDAARKSGGAEHAWQDIADLVASRLARYGCLAHPPTHPDDDCEACQDVIAMSVYYRAKPSGWKAPWHQTGTW